jgi:hypothetical protein
MEVQPGWPLSFSLSLSELEMEPRAMCTLGKCSTTEQHPRPHDGSSSRKISDRSMDCHLLDKKNSCVLDFPILNVDIQSVFCVLQFCGQWQKSPKQEHKIVLSSCQQQQTRLSQRAAGSPALPFPGSDPLFKLF